MASLPLVPVVTTPCHCATLHSQLACGVVNVILTGPLPGKALSARKTLIRLCGVVLLSKARVFTWVQLVIPPPVTLGLGAALPVLCANTAIVTSALAAGVMLAVVQTA